MITVNSLSNFEGHCFSFLEEISKLLVSGQSCIELPLTSHESGNLGESPQQWNFPDLLESQ